MPFVGSRLLFVAVLSYVGWSIHEVYNYQPVDPSDLSTTNTQFKLENYVDKTYDLEDGVVAAPVFIPDGDLYISRAKVRFLSKTPGATIKYNIVPYHPGQPVKHTEIKKDSSSALNGAIDSFPPTAFRIHANAVKDGMRSSRMVVSQPYIKELKPLDYRRVTYGQLERQLVTLMQHPQLKVLELSPEFQDERLMSKSNLVHFRFPPTNDIFQKYFTSFRLNHKKYELHHQVQLEYPDTKRLRKQLQLQLQQKVKTISKHKKSRAVAEPGAFKLQLEVKHYQEFYAQILFRSINSRTSSIKAYELRKSDESTPGAIKSEFYIKNFASTFAPGDYELLLALPESEQLHHVMVIGNLTLTPPGISDVYEQLKNGKLWKKYRMIAEYDHKYTSFKLYYTVGIHAVIILLFLVQTTKRRVLALFQLNSWIGSDKASVDDDVGRKSYASGSLACVGSVFLLWNWWLETISIAEVLAWTVVLSVYLSYVLAFWRMPQTLTQAESEGDIIDDYGYEEEEEEFVENNDDDSPAGSEDFEAQESEDTSRNASVVDVSVAQDQQLKKTQ